MRRLFLLALAVPLLAATPARAAAVDPRFPALRKELLDLEKDARRSRFRDAWAGIEGRLTRFARGRSEKDHGCDARFLAARAHAGMAAVSFLASDRREAAALYRAVARTCARSRLADDALYRAAELVAGSDPSDARADLARLLDRHPDGDFAPQARRLLASLPEERPQRTAERAARADPPARTEPPPREAPRALDVATLAHPDGGELPLSVVAGLKVRRVVIDPGHGGKDDGTTGPGGTREKDVALGIARKLKAQLEDAGLEAVLTRDDDTYPRLVDRTRLANEKGGDLLVSIHCNAVRNHDMHGIETYTLNLNSDRYAARLAARENEGSGQGIGGLQMILADLATKANTDDSVRLARIVQEQIVSDLRAEGGGEVRDRGVKQALFFVLVGAKMPAILVEAGFLSNPAEEKRLKSEAGQQRIAASIRQAVERFIAERERLARGEGTSDRGSGVF
jgi:N-acetylmuramoyl-L-alanine amidase